jgi:His/Glu/Gln/Arg/opine family amino acid ABC transporter permease subunit
LNRWQVFTRVVLPPALRKVWPALVSQIIIVMLGSAVCGQISTEELSYAANLIQSRNFRAFEAFIVATLIYLAAGRGRAPLPQLGRAAVPVRERPMIEFTLWDITRNLLLAARWTIGLSLIAFVGGGLVGLVLLVARLRGNPWATRFVGGYVQLFQGTPLLMQLFLAYFGIALFGINVSAWTAAAVALTLYTSAFLAEIWRGCVASIPKGQWEAAQSLALNFREQLRHVCCRRRCASRCRPPWASWCRWSRARRWPR